MVEPKVLIPGLLSRIEDADRLISNRIVHRRSRCFSERARDASESQIARNRFSTFCERDDMVDMKGSFL